jgi:hypothetical protein
MPGTSPPLGDVERRQPVEELLDPAAGSTCPWILVPS